MQDLETVEAELLLADLETAEHRLEAATKAARSGDRTAIAERGLWEQSVEELSRRPARPAGSRASDLQADAGGGERRRGRGSARRPLAERAAIAVCARDEAELAELEPGEAAAMRAELGLEQGALETLVRAIYGLLGLVTFFTAVGGSEIRARSLRQGSTAYDAAGRCTPTCSADS